MRAIVSRAEKVEGRVRAPPSKSYTHRAFIISSLAEGVSLIREPLLAGDTLATLKAVEAFGAQVERGKSDVRISDTGGVLESPRYIDCENSGTGLRLLTGVASLDGEVELTGDASLQRRPVQPLLDALAQLGVRAETLRENGKPPLKVYGKKCLEGGKVKIRGDISSQFISSLLIVSPFARREVEIELTTPLRSKPYLDKETQSAHSLPSGGSKRREHFSLCRRPDNL